MLEKRGIKVEEKELVRINKMTDNNGTIGREEFSDFAKHSSSVKLLMERLERVNNPKPPKANIDKAAAAFKVIVYCQPICVVINDVTLF